MSQRRGSWVSTSSPVSASRRAPAGSVRSARFRACRGRAAVERHLHAVINSPASRGRPDPRAGAAASSRRRPGGRPARPPGGGQSGGWPDPGVWASSAVTVAPDTSARPLYSTIAADVDRRHRRPRRPVPGRRYLAPCRPITKNCGSGYPRRGGSRSGAASGLRARGGSPATGSSTSAAGPARSLPRWPAPVPTWWGSTSPKRPCPGAPATSRTRVCTDPHRRGVPFADGASIWCGAAR